MKTMMRKLRSNLTKKWFVLKSNFLLDKVEKLMPSQFQKNQTR